MSSEEGLEGPLSYFLSENAHIVVISFVGPIVKSNIEVFEKAIQELLSRGGFEWVVLSFHDVDKVDRFATGPLARLQKEIRERPALLKHCFLAPDVRGFLENQGVLRPSEVSRNLAEALEMLKGEHGSLKSKLSVSAVTTVKKSAA